MSTLRSLLFVPGNKPDLFPKARDSGADAYCIDLEDAVPDEDKAHARKMALNHIANADANCFLRINGLATRAGMEDLLALASLGGANRPACIVVPMISSSFEIRQVIRVLGDVSSLRILPMIETPEGLDKLSAIVDEGAVCVEAVAFGCADYAAITGSDMSWDALLGARNSMVKAVSGRGIQCIDGPCFEVTDTATLEAECSRVSGIGFSGRLAIHPSQVASINEAFAPSDERVKWARGVVAAFESAGGGAVLHKGTMVDQPVVNQAKRIIASVKK